MRLIRRTTAILALFTVELLFALGVFLACFTVFFFLAKEILNGQHLSLDAAAFVFTDYLATDTLTSVITFITFFCFA